MTKGTTLAQIIRVTAESSPDAPAIVGEGRPVTHGELSTRSNALAAGLVASGLAVGDRVAYLARNATEYWELFFAAAKAGLVIVPLNYRLSADEVGWILSDAEPAAIVAEDHLTHLVPGGFVGPRLAFVQGDAETQTPTGWHAYEEWLASWPAVDPRREVHGDALFSLMYSSGTTGRPKGVTTTVGGFLWAVETFGAQFGVSSASVSLVPTPYHHIAAGGWSLIALAAGGRIVQFTEVTPQNMLSLMVGHHATHVIMVPTVMQRFITSAEASQADYSSVEWVVYGGSPISETVMVGAKEVFGAELAQSYGLTETIGVTTVLGAGDHVVGSTKLRSAGRPVPGVEVAVYDPHTGEQCDTGTVGEIVTRGPGVTQAYWRRPRETAITSWPGGWLRTGDAGYLDEDGYLFLKDRIKDVVTSGGENIYPAEVENAIMTYPAVQEVAVIGIPSEKWGETPHAVVVAKTGQTIDADALIAHTREHLAHYKCPTSVTVADALPRNLSGKVLKRELRAPWWAGHERNIG